MTNEAQMQMTDAEVREVFDEFITREVEQWKLLERFAKHYWEDEEEPIYYLLEAVSDEGIEDEPLSERARAAFEALTYDLSPDETYRGAAQALYGYLAGHYMLPLKKIRKEIKKNISTLW
jgi:hypothetical protein